MASAPSEGLHSYTQSSNVVTSVLSYRPQSSLHCATTYVHFQWPLHWHVGWPVNTKQLEYVEESKQHMRVEPFTLDQSWQHHLAMTFRCMVKVLIEDGFYCTHLCEDCNRQVCNILRWAHSPKCECNLKLNGTFGLKFLVQKKRRYCACLFKHPHVFRLCCYCKARERMVSAMAK
jgi:hypothetical protein